MQVCHRHRPVVAPTPRATRRCERPGEAEAIAGSGARGAAGRDTPDQRMDQGCGVDSERRELNNHGKIDSQVNSHPDAGREVACCLLSPCRHESTHHFPPATPRLLDLCATQRNATQQHISASKACVLSGWSLAFDWA